MSENLSQIECEVALAPGVPVVGVYANGFRILKDTGDEYFFDFVVYSAATKSAVLVSRTRVTRNLIPAIRARVVATFDEIQAAPPELSFVLPVDKDKIN
jgi:hypothetical protein